MVCRSFKQRFCEKRVFLAELANAERLNEFDEEEHAGDQALGLKVPNA